jgi:hypothetical protein
LLTLRVISLPPSRGRVICTSTGLDFTVGQADGVRGQVRQHHHAALGVAAYFDVGVAEVS